MIDKEIIAKIETKMDELYEMCVEARIPLFVTIANETKLGTEYINRVITPLNVSKELSNDKITMYNASLNNNLILRIKKNDPNDFVGDIYDDIIEE